MKLNNGGWGLREMLVLSAILIFFFCVAVYFIYIFYGSLTENFDDISVSEDLKIYEEYENDLYNAGIEYLNDLDSEYKDSIINLSTLIENGYIEKLVDPKSDNECNGYIKIEDIEYQEIELYIKCDNYETIGY